MRFLLIHGGFHGAWCWDEVISELAGLGHRAAAIDLPGHGHRRDERSTLADPRDAIVEALQAGDVLVGHSGGGYDMTVAAGGSVSKLMDDETTARDTFAKRSPAPTARLIVDAPFTVPHSPVRPD